MNNYGGENMLNIDEAKATLRILSSALIERNGPLDQDEMGAVNALVRAALLNLEAQS